MASLDVFLIGVYVAAEIISNVTASKVVAFGAITVPAAVFLYALTFTLVDLINTRLGKDRARAVIWTAVAANVLLAAYAQLAIALPAAPFYAAQDSFRAVLGSSTRVVAASLIAYIASGYVDTEVFARWRARFGTRYLWGRVASSNLVSLALDTALFITIAFAGTGAPLAALMLGQYLVKVGVTIVSVPLIYAVRPIAGARGDLSGPQKGTVNP